MQKLRTSTPELEIEMILTLHAEGFEQETNWLCVHLLTVKSELTANSQYYIGLDLSIPGEFYLSNRSVLMCRPMLLLQIVLRTVVLNR